MCFIPTGVPASFSSKNKGVNLENGINLRNPPPAPYSSTSVLFHALFIYHIGFSSHVRGLCLEKQGSIPGRMDESFDLSPLRDFLRETLAVTEEVRDTLKFEVDEAMFALKPWRVTSTVKKEINITCTCQKGSKAEEIAADIDRALWQTQQLREKLSNDKTKQRGGARNLHLSNVFPSDSASNKKYSKNKALGLDKESTTKRHCNITKEHTSIIEDNASTNVRFPGDLHERSKKSTHATNTNDRKIVKSPQYRAKLTEEADCLTKIKKCSSSLSSENDRAKNTNKIIRNPHKTSQPSPYNTLQPKTIGIHKKQKDFIKLNKSNLKNTVSAENRQKFNTKTSIAVTKPLHTQYTEYLKVKKDSSVASTSQLSELITKMSLESCSSNAHEESCPLYGDSSPRFMHEKNVLTMDVTEGLDRFGVLGELVDVSRIYHSYVNMFHSSNGDKSTRKGRNVFLTEFNKMEENIQSHSRERKQFINLSKEFILLFQEMICNNADTTIYDKTNRLFSEFNSRWVRHCTDVLNFGIPKKQQRLLHDEFSKNWMSNGFWNRFCIRNFKGMSKAHCIRYSSNAQLFSFFEATQELQQTYHLKHVIDIILRTIIPKLKHSFNPENPDHILAYKMIWILHQGLNPKLPILVRTDK